MAANKAISGEPTAASALLRSIEVMITYVTRSRLIGFPDYTTVEAKDGMVTVFARLRFGRSDLGVNRRRVEGWIKALGA